MRQAAIKALGGIGNKRAVDVLLEVVVSRTAGRGDDWLYAAQALRDIADVRAVLHLAKLANDPSAALAASAALNVMLESCVRELSLPAIRSLAAMEDYAGFGWYEIDRLTEKYSETLRALKSSIREQAEEELERRGEIAQ